MCGAILTSLVNGIRFVLKLNLTSWAYNSEKPLLVPTMARKSDIPGSYFLANMNLEGIN